MISLIGVALIIGIGFIIRQQLRGGSDRPTEESGTIRMSKTIRGTVTDVMQSAQLVTIQDDKGQEIHLALVSETHITNEKNDAIDLAQIYRGSVVEGRGESASSNAFIVGELRIVSTPDFIITAPNEADPVTSPLTIEGLATGPWYFEAVFPVTITDANRRPLKKHYVTATKDWMSESLVPFTATLEFEQPKTATGYIIFSNANPSDLRENDKTFEMPITFSPQTRKVKVFFNNSKLDPAFLCDKVFPVTREIDWTEGIGRAAVEELLKGPNTQDKSADYFTNISPNARVNSLVIENGTALIDFSEELGRNAAGSCRATAIRTQITETLKQFTTVNEVVISINGRTKDILQP